MIVSCTQSRSKDSQTLHEEIERLIAINQAKRDVASELNLESDAKMVACTALAYLEMAFEHLMIGNFLQALNLKETAENIMEDFSEEPASKEITTTTHSRDESEKKVGGNVELQSPAVDGSSELFRAELLQIANRPKIGAVIEESKQKRVAIWGSQAGFGEFAQSTYFPLLMCLDDPQERPRAILQAVNAGNTRLAVLYRQSIGLSEYYNPRIKPRIRTTQWLEEWRSDFMVIEIIAQMRWLEATDDRNAYIRGAVLRAFQNRQSEEEHEHIKAGKAGAVIEYLDHGEVVDPWPSIAALEFELDFDSALLHANKLGISGDEFPQIMRDWVLSGHTWENIAARKDVPPEERKHFSDTAKRLYQPKLRCFRERMKAYYRPPRKTLDERLAADRLSKPGSSIARFRSRKKF